ncbi:MAG: YdcF family protein [Bacteroidetes bacterium]|nr:YdcF family protein [Bacteroidota bacterium]
MARFAIIRKKERWSTTWLGKLIAVMLLLGMAFVFSRTIHPFLAKNEPIQAGILVVEGFIPDYAIEACMQIFERGGYKKLIITGKKRMKGAHLDQYENDGEFSAATLQGLGFDRSKIIVIALDEDIQRDRTYASAVALHDWMIHNNWKDNFNLATLGTHARRSQLLFEKAFDHQNQIGIISIPNQSYQAKKWWKSSQGFREVTKELIAWIYAQYFFFPED